MTRIFAGLPAILLFIITSASYSAEFTPGYVNSLRAPAYPLVTMDPYISTWSFTDNLYDDFPRHWTGTQRTLTGAIKVDGKIYRFMGKEEIPVQQVAPSGDAENWCGRYTSVKPESGWESLSFDDSKWKDGCAPFTFRAIPPGTNWRTKDIWVRRIFELDRGISPDELLFKYSHDDNADIYINGILFIRTVGEGRLFRYAEFTEDVKRSLRPGKNIIAVHGNNEAGLNMLDFGVVRKTGAKQLFTQTARQMSVNLLPTQTWYKFECGPVELDLVFTTPMLQDDLYLMSRPVTYLTWQVRSMDSKDHSVQVYIETTPEWAVNTLGQSVETEMFTENGITFLKTGTKEQPVLAKHGDDLRIDWGYYYLASVKQSNISMAAGDPGMLKREFIKAGLLRNTIDSSLPDKISLRMTALSVVNDLGKVGKNVSSGFVMIGYDDIYSIRYFGEDLMAYWKRNGTVDIRKAFSLAAVEYGKIMRRCMEFDKQLMEDAEKAGGKKYAGLCALTYRQSLAAQKLVATRDGELHFMSKENFSNGCITTVDVTFPASPLCLVYNTDLVKGMLNGVFYYSESGIFKHEFAPHDLGYYPIANGQVNREDGSERVMPVEESGNMLILTAAIAVLEGKADYAERHWKILTQWADYLVKNGLDPVNQLSSEDMTGLLAHNTNLSLKAIIAIGGYAKMAGMLGKNDIEGKYMLIARSMASEWIRMAKDDDHYRIAFDRPGTWSQKYNLPWDRMLGLNLFPPEVAEAEVRYYLKKQNKYGLPLDIRNSYTINYDNIWSAVLASDDNDFRALTDPIWRYANETPHRIPLSDWHETTTGLHIGMRARSTVGGYFMKLLEQKINLISK